MAKTRHWANEHIDDYEDNPNIRDHLLGTHEEETKDYAADIPEMDLISLNDQHAEIHGIFDT